MNLTPFLALAVLASCLSPAAAQAPEPNGLPELVVLVRHAEKAAQPADDPALSEAGTARAQALAAALEDAGVTAIITSQLRRTRDTIRPLANALELTPVAVAVGSGGLDAHAAAVAAAVREYPGGVVLVAGHSNTIPAIIAALGGPQLPDISETVYSNLFILFRAEGEARLIRSRYGAPDGRGE